MLVPDVFTLFSLAFIVFQQKINEPVHEISNNVAFDMCRLRRAFVASF